MTRSKSHANFISNEIATALTISKRNFLLVYAFINAISDQLILKTDAKLRLFFELTK